GIALELKIERGGIGHQRQDLLFDRHEGGRELGDQRIQQEVQIRVPDLIHLRAQVEVDRDVEVIFVVEGVGLARREERSREDEELARRVLLRDAKKAFTLLSMRRAAAESCKSA